MITKYCFSILFTLLVLSGCNNFPNQNYIEKGRIPVLEPDYSYTIIPPNIAPMNFLIKEVGSGYSANFLIGSETILKISSKDGVIQIPERKWREMLMNNKGKDLKVDIYLKDKNGQWSKFQTITNKIATAPIDEFVFYRLLYPGYESWAELSIKERNLENFSERSLIENSVADENCVNCHTFNNGKTGDFLFHMRGSLGATYFYSGGEFKKVNLKTKEMKNGAVYPSWHPSGKFVAFSSNKITQRFHAADNKKVEVTDLESSLVLYDVAKNEIMDIQLTNRDSVMDTYPEWSPDGLYIYFCRAAQIGKDYDYKQIKYNLCRASFDADKRIFGEVEMVFDAVQLNKSVSFPKISPDGKFLIVTMADYGCFPIWHKEADLYSVNLVNFKTVRLDLNSEYTDSYHSWSSNGKWLIFSSKRGDGLTARPYIAYIDKNGNSDKPFILPQEDPEFYKRFLKTFNIPEFSRNEIKLNPGEIRKLAETEATPAKWSKN